MPAVRTPRATPVAPPSPTGTPTVAAICAKVRQIPESQVASYGDIARYVGFPKHSRLVGATLKLLPTSLSSPTLPQERLPTPDRGSRSSTADYQDDVLPPPLPNPDFVPWHRVLSSTGVISPRGSTTAVMRQADFLRAEGVEVRDGPHAGGGGGAGGAPGIAGTVDAFGLGGVDGGRVSMVEYRWDGRVED